MKKISLFLILTIIISNLTSFNVKAAASAITVLTSEVGARAGDAVTTTVTIRNTSSSDLSNLQIRTTAGELDAVVTSSVNSLAAGEEALIGVKVFPAHSTQASVQFLDMSFVYMQAGVLNSQNATIMVSVAAGEAVPPSSSPAPDTVTQLAMTAPTTYISATAGRTVSVDVTLKNTGNASANLIKIISPVKPDFALSLPNNIPQFSLAKNESRTFTVNITPDKSLKDGNYEVTFNYTFENETKRVTEGSFTISLKVDKLDQGNASVVLSDFSVTPDVITAGDSFSMYLSAKNLGKQGAKNVQLSIDSLETDKITTVNSSNTILIGDLKSGASYDLAFSLTSGEKMKSGSYPVKFTLKYADVEDVVVTETSTYYVRIVSKTASTDDLRAMVEITDITRPTKQYAVAEDALINVVIKNTGDKAAKNVTIKATPESGLVPKAANIQLVNSLEAGESRTVAFVFAPTAAARTQNYTIGFTVDYQTGQLNDDETPKTDQFMQYTGINATNPDADKEDETATKSVPKIIISDYKIEPLIVMAGQEFDLDLTFLNTHSTKTVSNITVSLTYVATETEKGNVFTPVGSSNIFYIDEIAPKAVSKQYMRMYTVPDAKAKNYIITANFDYEDEDGAKLTTKAEFGINVKQVTKLETGDIFFPTNLSVGQEQYLSFNVQNTGMVMLRNLKIKVEGEGIDNFNSEQIFGNFPAGSYNSYDGSFIPKTSGQTTLTLVISYDDDMGERQEIRESYECNIAEASVPDFGGDFGERYPGGMQMGDNVQFDKNGNPIDPNAVKWYYPSALVKNIWFWAGVGAVVAVIAVAAVLVVRKRKQRKGLDFDE